LAILATSSWFPASFISKERRARVETIVAEEPKKNKEDAA